MQPTIAPYPPITSGGPVPPDVAAGRDGAIAATTSLIASGEDAAVPTPRPHASAGFWLRRRLGGLHIASRGEALQAVEYTPSLVACVVIVAGAAAAVAAITVRPPADGATLAVGALAIFLMAAFAVRLLHPVQINWSASTFLYLGLVLTLGPAGAAAGAFAEALGLMMRARNGWFRTTFNFSNHFLAGVAAYEVFTRVVALVGSGPLGAACAGLAAGAVHFLVEYPLLSVIISAANRRVDLGAVIRGGSYAPFSLGYGWSAFAFVVVHDHAGPVGFTALLLPAVLLQASLVVFTTRVQAYEAQRAAHQREREELLQKAVEASEAERRRIARDLHDGVVQNLTGMAFALTAASARLKESANESGNEHLVELLDGSAEETRSAMKDLRTLIIEIAPPTLRREGLHAALLEVLKTLEQGGTETSLELPSNMRLRQDRANLIFRVAQEVLRNVAAHAEAKHVTVLLRQEDGHAVLKVEDDGKGFSPEDLARRRNEGHVGTSGIVELAEDAGGTLSIDSTPGNGTRVTLLVPVE